MDQQDNKAAIDVAYWYDEDSEAKSNDYQQLGNRYRSLSDEAKKELIPNIITEIKSIDGPDKEMAVNLQLCHWFRMDIGLGMAVANGMNINLQDLMKNMPMP